MSTKAMPVMVQRCSPSISEALLWLDKPVVAAATTAAFVWEVEQL